MRAASCAYEYKKPLSHKKKIYKRSQPLTRLTLAQHNPCKPFTPRYRDSSEVLAGDAACACRSPIFQPRSVFFRVQGKLCERNGCLDTPSISFHLNHMRRLRRCVIQKGKERPEIICKTHPNQNSPHSIFLLESSFVNLHVKICGLNRGAWNNVGRHWLFLSPLIALSCWYYQLGVPTPFSKACFRYRYRCRGACPLR